MLSDFSGRAAEKRQHSSKGVFSPFCGLLEHCSASRLVPEIRFRAERHGDAQRSSAAKRLRLFAADKRSSRGGCLRNASHLLKRRFGFLLFRTAVFFMPAA